MRAARLAAAHHHRELQAPDLLYETGVVQWILVNVNTAPDTGVIRPDWDNAQTRLNAFEVFDPQLVNRWLAHHDGFASLLPVSTRRLNFVCSIGDVQAGKNRFEPGDVGHFFFLKRVGPTHAGRGTRVVPTKSYLACINYQSPKHFRPRKSEWSGSVTGCSSFAFVLDFHVARADRLCKCLCCVVHVS